MSHRDRRRILVLTIGLCVLPVHATTYKWADTDGVVHYSQTPPDGTPSTVIEPSTSETSTQNTRPRSDSTRSTTISPPPPQDDVAQFRAENCIAAKHNLMVLENNNHIRVEENGKLRVLSQDERSTRIERLNRQTSELCE